MGVPTGPAEEARHMEIDRLTQLDAARVVDPLLHEYVTWVFDGAQEHFGVEFADRDAVIELRHAEFGNSLPELLTGRGRLLLASVDGVPAGVGALKPIDGSIAEVKRMFVRPAARGAGIGRAILQRLLGDAHAEGFQLVRLETMTFMRPALVLYRSLGFVDVPTFDGSETAAVGLEERTCYLQRDLALRVRGVSAGAGST